MHITKVVIKGFRSYKNCEAEFHPNVNAIVGRNGSGKSNFFNAIRFILSDSYRADERHKLFFEQPGHAPTLEAQVFVHFDNSDGRFPINDTTVVLQRIIGRSKDGYYYINNKKASKQEVVNLLESAGFSRANPYFIVQQGRIAALTMMSERERLELLKEVAGTRVYEERREESVKLIKDGESKMEKTNELIEYINERLAELEEEKEELSEYQKLDRERRCLEYTIYDKQLNSATRKLKEIEEIQRQEELNSKSVHEAASDIEAKLEELKQELQRVGVSLQQHVQEKASLDDEVHLLVQQKAALELDVGEAGGKLDSQKSSSERAREELKELDALIAEKQGVLETAKEAFDKTQRTELAITEKVNQCETRLNALYAKVGRSAQFSTRAERDKALKADVKELQTAIKKKAAQVKESEAAVVEATAAIERESTVAEELEKSLESRAAGMEELTQKCAALRQKRDSLADTRKECWRKDEEVQAAIRAAQESLNSNDRILHSTLDKATSDGLNAVMRVAAERNIPGVYGPLVSLIKCDDQFMTAVEVTAGKSLFHVVVDTDDTASRVIEVMNEHRLGRVTFMPLNRLQSRRAELVRTADVLPLVEQVRCDAKFQPAVQQVFGRTLLCSSMDVASSFARTYGVNCVTQFGDQVNRQGALTGGFYDVRHSRMQCMKQILHWRAQLEQLSAKAAKAKVACAKADAAVAALLDEIQVAETELRQLRSSLDEDNYRARAAAREVRELEKVLEQRERSAAEQRITLQRLETTKRSLEEEIGTEMHSQLGDAEKAELEALNGQVSGLQEEYIAASRERAEAEKAKIELESLLNSNLRKRQEQLQEQLGEILTSDTASESARLEAELRQTEADLRLALERQAETEQEIESETSRVVKLKEEMEELKSSEYDQAQEVQSKSKTVESFFNKRSLYMQQREEAMRKIRELGSLPSEAFEAYQNRSTAKLMKALHRVKEQLKAYSGVNQKALDQYLRFTTQREGLVERQQELEESQQAIAMLMTTLDQKKDEAIFLTLTGVSRQFEEVFRDLVPRGSATLTAVIRDPLADDGDEDAEEMESLAEGGQHQVRRYAGLRIEAAFSDAPPRPLESLSGGQKTVVALALIFAIQRCDPAPFYLFDEIDSALDPAHRAAVADMIRRQAEEADSQFIVSTFKPELLDAVDRFFCVTMGEDKASRVKSVSKVVAQGVIALQPSDAARDEDGDVSMSDSASVESF
mmetsp:Transcript_7907/g.33278  ORF Transcript_7907/g.33278 Transcript_7907/m.33278 type:complete len:1220 (+) Transcript_7907:138-3797(+)